jgi:16S rRNA (uracil1498-N3)-methyltransferase
MASSIRLFIAAPLAPLWAPAATVPLDAGQSHYLSHVLRRTSGDSVLVFNGRDGEFHARITRLAKSGGAVELAEQRRPQVPGPDLWLLFAPVKRDATDLVIRAATELGVSRIQPVWTARTQMARLNAERWQAIAIEAAEQSERLTLPEIAPAVKLADVLGQWDRARPLYAALERSTAAAALPEHAAALLVGPEGGFTAEERALLLRQDFVRPLSLGATVLRAETAAIAGLALLGQRMDRSSEGF